jgi:hypothetical protein
MVHYGNHPPPHLCYSSTRVYFYNHALMALPLEPQYTVPWNFTGKFSAYYLLTKQMDGQTIQKRRLVAKRRIVAGVIMGRLGIPHLDKTIRRFPQNLIQKIHIKESSNPTANLPFIIHHWTQQTTPL